MAKQRGRKSAEDLSAVTALPERPKPPKQLTKEQAKIWQRVVKRMPVDWFGEETHDLLSQYCRHVVDAERVAKLIDEGAKQVSTDDLDRLLKMQERESRALASFSVRLGLAYSTAYEKRRNSNLRKPWE